MNRISFTSHKKVIKVFLCILFTTNFSLFSQYNDIEKKLIDFGITVYNKIYNVKNERLSIETDSIISNNFSKIYIEPFDHEVLISDYSKIDSIITQKYKGKEILSKQIFTETYGDLYSYVIHNSKGNPYYDRYFIRKYKNRKILISYNSIMGNNRSNFLKFECLINKMRLY